jgi:hypothetical protein
LGDAIEFNFQFSIPLKGAIMQQTTDKSAGVFSNSNHRINEEVDWD